MEKTEALERLESIIKELTDLKSESAEDSDFKKWKRRTEKQIEKIFKEHDESQVSEFFDIEFEDIDPRDTDLDEEYFIQGKKSAITLLESFMEEVNEWEDSQREKNKQSLINLFDEKNIMSMIEKFERFGANPEFIIWKNKVEQTIEKICGKNSKYIKQFKNIEFLDTGYRPMDGYEVPADKTTFQKGIQISIAIITSILDEVNNGVYDQEDIKSLNESSKTIEIDSTKVFIVHGHDDKLKTEVELFLKNQDLKPIILHKQANMGKTIIEKLEHYGNVGYAIVLYTPCDLGKATNDNELKPRARQNVVFEHGYFIGLLGRDKVSFLVDEGIETPGDISGIVYQAKSYYWQYDLVRELKAAGYNVSADKVSI